MSKPTLEAIFSQARSLLGDDGIAGGSIFTDQVLQPHAAQCIRELFRVLRGTEDPFVLQDAYWLLPAETVVLDPATMGLANFGDVEWVEWQLGGVSIPVIGCVVGNVGGVPQATVTTGTPHGLSQGATVVVFGLGGFDYFNNPNNLWSVGVTAPSTLTLNGCTATGTYVAGTGTVMGVTGQFAGMSPRDRLSMVAAAPGPMPVNIYAWEGGVLRFLPASQPMILRVVYRTSGAVPTNPNAVIPIEDSQDYLATRCAGLAAKTRGAAQMGEALTEEALGPGKQADGNGGLLRQLVQIDVRNSQRQQYRWRPFRDRRNNQDAILF